jgi:hypothetical protein
MTNIQQVQIIALSFALWWIWQHRHKLGGWVTGFELK